MLGVMAFEMTTETTETCGFWRQTLELVSEV